MELPSFSICIPNYNYGRYIGETIQSILNQTYQNFEIIVTDNASTDNSVKEIKSFVQTYSPVSIFDVQFSKPGQINLEISKNQIAMVYVIDGELQFVEEN